MTTAVFKKLVYLLPVLLIAGIAFCGNQQQSKTDNKQTQSGGNNMKIESTVFNNEETIPVKYTCDGEDVSPPLKWSDVPDNVKSFALICDDPDAPPKTWVHWVVANIPPVITGLEEGVDISAEKFEGAIQCRNDFGKVEYGGPCPPPGGPHRYYFKLYALDTKLDVKAESTKADVENAMEGHILAEAQLMGKYGRK